MLNLGSFRSRSCGGVSRRAFVQAASMLPWSWSSAWAEKENGRQSSAGVGTPEMAAAERKPVRPGRAKSVLMIWLWGGPSHLDTFDPKPEASSEIRSPFATIQTRTPGMQFTELFPRLAQRSEHLTLVRSCRFSGNHDMLCLTGARRNGGQREPNFGSIVAKHEVRGDLPAFISVVPRTSMSHGFPCVNVPGYDAGRLGAAYNPFIVRAASDSFVQIPSLELADGLTPERLTERRFLLEQLDLLKRRMNTSELAAMDQQHDNAYSLLMGKDSFKAFDLSRESARTRQAYGRTAFGQSMLLGRRLVEAGVPYVQVNWSLGVDGLEEGPLMGWDTHRNGFGQLMTYHGPIFDRAFSALLDDLHERGLLQETLVVAMGEMGRSPKINKIGGREHWATCTTLWAGAGAGGGRVIGKTDRIGAEPVTTPVTPLMVGTTIAEAMGMNSEARAEMRILAGGSTIEGLL